MEVGIIFLIYRIELFDFIFFQDGFQKLLSFDNIFNIAVFYLVLGSVLFATGDAIGNFEKLLSDLSDSIVLALVDLSI